MKIWSVCCLYLTISFLFSSTAFGQGAEADSVKRNIKPRRVMFSSLILPGYGQYKNRQAWKIPVIYGALAGLVVFNRNQASNYEDFRAAFFNLENPGAEQMFGPTPEYLQRYTNKDQLRNLRDYYRNQRDISYVYIALAYGFNALDAYIWAHLRMFDVSDNLTLAPGYIQTPRGVESVLTARFSF